MNRLTPHQREIARLLATGLTCKQIAESRGVGLTAIENSRTIIYKALEIHNVVELTHWAIRTKLLAVLNVGKEGKQDGR